ncbi:pseudouridine synthase, partial [Neolentinus lepideus HHB14362 ss-1]
MSVNVHHRDDDDHSGPDPKRTKLTEDTDDPDIIVPEPDHPTDDDNLLPPSHALLGLPKQHYPDGVLRIMENDVGISEYIASDLPQIHGIIKQRFTDFLVFEVDLDGNEIHLKDIGPPDTPTNNQNSDAPTETPTEPAPITPDTLMEDVQSTVPTASEDSASKDSEPWPDSFTARLQPYFSPSKLDDLKKMYLEGPEPPFVSDSGWAGRQPKADGETAEGVGEKEEQKDAVEEREPGRGRRGRGRGRGGRGRGGGRPRPGERPDNRRVISDPIPSKQIRTELHQAVRELFRGKLDTETDTTNPDSAAIVVRWNKQPLGRSNRDPKHPAPSSSRGNYPPYIHFTLQKTSRDTQDALAHLARLLHVPLNHLAVAGTKDKRGVTVQRVSLKRDGKDVMAVWAAVNALHREGRTAEDAVRERGERGVRIADLSYKRQGLELGNLKGNAFVITLRNVHAASPPTLDRALSSLRTRGFVNYYGMQRFGTASIPTHAIGLALLQGAWQKAVSMILRERPGEHPDVVAARRAWLVDGDLAGALERMPRRVVAERCILESYRKMKGDTRNAFGALQTIPKNLRLMYVHAYQSYLWNA